MGDSLHIRSEIGRVKKVMLHRPGREFLNLSPDSMGRLLFDDIPYLAAAQEEHDRFAELLRENDVEVLYLDQLVAESIASSAAAREELLDCWLAQSGVSSPSVLEAVKDKLERIEDPLVLVDKLIEGVRADELEFCASGACRSLADVVAAGGNEHGGLLIDPIPNLYFTRDPFSIIGQGVSLNSMWSVTRRREPLFGQIVFKHHPVYAGAPVWHEPGHEASGCIEGGDILVLGPSTIGVGISERTDAAGIDALAETLLWGSPASGVDRVLAFSIPRKRSCMHLDTVFTQLDVDAFLVHPGILGTLKVFELTRGASVGSTAIRSLEGMPLESVLANAIGVDSVRIYECGGGDPLAAAREQWNDGANTLAVSPGKVIVYQRNSVTNDLLYKSGFDLIEVPSSELSRGRGGPHCMSMAFEREDL